MPEFTRNLTSMPIFGGYLLPFFTPPLHERAKMHIPYPLIPSRPLNPARAGILFSPIHSAKKGRTSWDFSLFAPFNG